MALDPAKRPRILIKKVAETETVVKYRCGFPEPKWAITIRKRDWQRKLEDGAPTGAATTVLHWLTMEMVFKKAPRWPDEATIVL